MKKPWYSWIGKFLLLAVAVAGAIADVFGAGIPLWAILMPGLTWLAQFLLGLLPGEAWQGIVGRGILLLVSLAQLIVDQYSPGNQFWLVIAPLATAVAQYFISKIPNPVAPS